MVRDALVEALPGHDTEFAFSDIKPRPMFWRVMPLEALGDTAGLYGRKCLVQRGRFVGVEIILHKRDLFSVREVVIGQITKYMGVINGSTPFANGDMTPTSKRREQHE